MNVIEVDITKLKAAPYNPRTLSQPAFENIQRSIDEFTLLQPIIVNKTTGYIVGGHQRVQAAKALGHTTVPVVYVELDPGREQALNVLLNNPKAQGEFDVDSLAELLDGLDDESLLLTGYDEDDLDKLQDGFITHDEDGPVPDDKPKVKKYSVDDLKKEFKSYPFNEHRAIVDSAVEWLRGRS